MSKKVSRLINNFSTIQNEMIEYKCIEDLNWDQIIDKTSYSERSLKFKRSEAVKSIAITLFGRKVFKDEEPNLFNLINT